MSDVPVVSGGAAQPPWLLKPDSDGWWWCFDNEKIEMVKVENQTARIFKFPLGGTWVPLGTTSHRQWLKVAEPTAPKPRFMRGKVFRLTNTVFPLTSFDHTDWVLLTIRLHHAGDKRWKTTEAIANSLFALRNLGLDCFWLAGKSLSYCGASPVVDQGVFSRDNLELHRGKRYSYNEEVSVKQELARHGRRAWKFFKNLVLAARVAASRAKRGEQ